MSKVLVPLADGFEEIEAVTIVDLLRRAGVEVRTASLAGREVTGSHGITVMADSGLDEVEAGDYDMIVLPGGMPGTTHLKSDSRVARLLRQFAESGRYTAAICAAPSVLAHAGLLEGRKATSFPGFLTPGSRHGAALRSRAHRAARRARSAARRAGPAAVAVATGRRLRSPVAPRPTAPRAAAPRPTAN
jgi:4-methyl-5(b-hydroxyethyl)-thiazole monophosphate biosynthesis